MIQIREIDHVVVRVRDMERMRRFYGEVLGCLPAREDLQLGLVQLRAGRSLIDLVDVNSPLGHKGGAAPGAQAHNMDHVCFRVEPWDAAAIFAILQGLQVAAGPVERRHGAEGFGPSIYVQDPEGNTVELKGPPERA